MSRPWSARGGVRTYAHTISNRKKGGGGGGGGRGAGGGGGGGGECWSKDEGVRMSRSYAVSAPADQDASQLYYSYRIIP